MLLVKAEAAPSRIHGLGLIAREWIPAGTAVWRFTPGFDVLIRERDLRSLSEAARAYVRHYAYFHAASRSYVLSSDHDRFTNHADDPNTRPVGDRTVAVRDIGPGEEITSDYAELGRLDYGRAPGSRGDRPWATTARRALPAD
jgi:SET domain-containing protein